MEPINYESMIKPPDFVNSFGKGLQIGENLSANVEKIKSLQAANNLKQQYQKDLQSVFQNPTANNFAALSLKYPQQREAFKQSWDTLNQDQKDNEFLVGSQVYNAVTNKQPDVAKDLLDQQITAFENSGKNADKLKAIRSTLDQNPESLTPQLGLLLSSIDPEKWSKMASESRAAEEAPAKLSTAQSLAKKAAIAAKYAESDAVLDLQKKGWDITKLQEDIKIAKENTKIAALNAQINKEGKDVQKQELQLKLAEFVKKRDDEVKNKAADVTATRSTIDNFLNTADRTLQTPKEVINAATGPISSKLPTTNQETANFEELINTLGSQTFLSQVGAMKGLGALSNAEGSKLESGLQNLSLRQSPERLIDNVKEIQRLMLKAHKNLSTRYGVPDVIPDTPNAAKPSNNKSTDDMLRELGVIK